ncbi:hypothetical protein AAGT13_20915 [Azotobacter salinestris]
MATEAISPVLGRVLACFAAPIPVPAGSQEFHQAMAMRAAQLVRQCLSDEARKRMKQECIAHLRASLLNNEPHFGGSNVSS